MAKSYWMVVQSPQEFEITRSRGFTLYGMAGRYRRRAQRMQPDDHVLFYVSQTRRWTATAIVTSHCFEDHSPVWKVNGQGEEYPHRVKLAPDIVLQEEEFIDALILAPRLEYVKRWAPEDWPLAFYEKLHLLPQRDFRLIESEMKRNLVKRRRGPTERGPGEHEPLTTEGPAVVITQAQQRESQGR